MALLSLSGVHSFYGHIEALRGIDVEVEQGEIVTLIGANGAGKTTLLRAISRMLSLEAGEIRFLGHSIAAKRKHLLALYGLLRVN